MSNKTTADTKIQVYLTYPGGDLSKLGQPVSLQRATEMARSFVREKSTCVSGGKVKLAYDVIENKKNKGKLIFELPYTKFVNFHCDACMGSCVSMPLDAKQRLKMCREHIRLGRCKDAVISSVIGRGLYPNKYSKTR